MRYGLNLLLWTDTLDEGILPVLEDIKRIGYDVVEVPIFECDVAKYGRWGKRFDDAGLARTGVTIRGVEDNPMSPEAAVRSKGIEANKAAVDCAAAAGCTALVGPYHSALGYFSGAGPTADEWRWAADSMRQVAEHADRAGVTLGLEYLNRFECYLLNTAADGARFCRAVNHPRCQMMYDTFHSHIEEKNTPAAIRALKGMLAHVHISENDRSTPGQGNVRWAETFDTLKEIGYDNLMVVEAFGLALEKIVAATKIWRRMYQSEHQLASDALRFMKEQVAQRWK
ncbi:MAG: sugar phosphate isomerase/epimerase family protein [Thermoguttaceae bacterium]|jgi:D-psicose/D-tagatose/L-ribulose 3-epimerase